MTEDRTETDWDWELTKGFAGRLIRQKAKQLVRQKVFRSSERADLEQDLRLALWERVGKFDPEVAHWNVFATTVIERQVATLCEQRQADKRGFVDPPISLSTLIPDCDDELVPLEDLVEPDHQQARIGISRPNELELAELRCELEDELARLPDELRELAEKLKYFSLMEISHGRACHGAAYAGGWSNSAKHSQTKTFEKIGRKKGQFVSQSGR